MGGCEAGKTMNMPEDKTDKGLFWFAIAIALFAAYWAVKQF